MMQLALIKTQGRALVPLNEANKALLDKKRIGTQKQTLLEFANGFLDVVANQRASLDVEKRFET
ncbi:hypothetical protein [Enterovibrio norvegicus]|uniref:hypothetical protein n=1 Tax=Enterovibrio norvegicus TaxID=188144 RepID=UPI001E499180|nr:hypothetical protein [Enterovibrio norvegicus]MCC4796904.1 hypothetical protein [Enterovibrio norvegicus]